MIVEDTGNIITSEAEALVNTVNTVGVMGKGIALQFKRAFPDNFRAYEKACRRGEVHIGKMFVTYTGVFSPRLIINFPTKVHWRSNASISHIESGLVDLVRVVKQENIQSIAIPPLGCGLGGLRWEDVRPLIEAAFRNLTDVEVVLYEPGSKGSLSSITRTPKPAMTTWLAALVVLIEKYAELGFEATHLEAQKLMYFLAVVEAPISARFAKGDYGPYDQGMRHALIGIDGHYLSGFGDGKRLDSVALLPNAANEAHACLDSNPAIYESVERVASLIEGFESPYGLELLATVHWVVSNEKAITDEEIIAKAHNWNPRKAKTLDSSHIRIAADQLRRLGWIQPGSSSE